MTTVAPQEQDPRLVDASQKWEATFAEYGIEDPWLQELGLAMVNDLTAIHADSRAFVDSREQSDIQVPVIDQTSVDELTRSILGEEVVHKIAPLVEFFHDFEKPAKQDSEDSPRDKITLLHDAFAYKVFGNGDDSRWVRRRMVKHMPKVDRLTEFWNEHAVPESPPLIDGEKADTIRERIVNPLADIFAKLPDGENEDFLPEVRRRLLAAGAIDPGTSVTTLKFLVATDIVRAFSHPLIRSAFGRFAGPSTQKVAASPHAGLYNATDLISDLTYGRHNDAWNFLGRIRDKHLQKRHYTFASRKFNNVFGELKGLTALYHQLNVVEQDLAELPKRQEIISEVVRTRDAESVNGLVIELADTSASAYDNMIEQLNPRLAGQDDETRAELWRQARGFDGLRIVLTTAIYDELQESGVKIFASNVNTMDIVLQPTVDKYLVRFRQEYDLETLRSEIDARLLQLDFIDSPYHLTNNQLRQRAPETIRLAKILSESIKDHEPLPIEAARSVVALMRGAYSEQWGSAAKDYSAMIKKYLADAQDLRELSLDLEFFGQPKQSKLVETLNLLDELIDSGTFDNLEAHPELAVFEDFLLEYLIATAVAATQEVEVVPDTDAVPPIFETEEPDEPEIPIETIGQAEYEDLLIFPPGTSEKDIIQDYVHGVSEADLPSIEWGRITRLIELRNKLTEQGLAVQFMRTKHASWQVLPFFILEARLPEAKRPVVVVESPVYGNATYIYREAAERPEWREVVQLSRRDARELGAVPMVHVDGTRLDIHFRKVWNRLISEMTIRQ